MTDWRCSRRCSAKNELPRLLRHATLPPSCICWKRTRTYDNKRYYILLLDCVCSLVSNGRGANRGIGFCITVHVFSRSPFVARCSKPFRIPRYAIVSKTEERLRERERPRHIGGGINGGPRGGGRGEGGERIPAYIDRARVLFRRLLRLESRSAVVASRLCHLTVPIYAVHVLLSLARVSVLRVPFFSFLPSVCDAN